MLTALLLSLALNLALCLAWTAARDGRRRAEAALERTSGERDTLRLHLAARRGEGRVVEFRHRGAL